MHNGNKNTIIDQKLLFLDRYGQLCKFDLFLVSNCCSFDAMEKFPIILTFFVIGFDPFIYCYCTYCC